MLMFENAKKGDLFITKSDEVVKYLGPHPINNHQMLERENGEILLVTEFGHALSLKNDIVRKVSQTNEKLGGPLNIVRQRFIRCLQRHLNEVKLWNEIAAKASESKDLFGLQYANRKVSEHMDMCYFWRMAINNVNYVKGTWSYKF